MSATRLRVGVDSWGGVGKADGNREEPQDNAEDEQDQLSMQHWTHAQGDTEQIRRAVDAAQLVSHGADWERTTAVPLYLDRRTLPMSGS